MPIRCYINIKWQVNFLCFGVYVYAASLLGHQDMDTWVNVKVINMTKLHGTSIHSSVHIIAITMIPEDQQILTHTDTHAHKVWAIIE